MSKEGDKNQDYFKRSFDLAYFIHVSKDLAFFVAEDAIDDLPLMLGNQGKHRQPPDRLRGFWKGGERARPIRQTIRIDDIQMLQWLVYKHSQSWERQTEAGDGPYQPTEEDMIVRYVELLVFRTLRRGSFYVALAVGPILHQFDRRETRLLYDVLTQSDSARMKDMSYIGKQRLELLEEICDRFDQMISTVKKSGDEKQLLARQPIEWVIDLVDRCLLRFTPWDTSCVVDPGFDITYIPGLYFSGTGETDEDEVETNRIHALLHPKCFALFADGLSKYVRMLPVDNQDKKCRFDALNERLIVPEFSNVTKGPPRGDRFQPPALTNEDYIRLQRTLEAKSRRRKNFVPRQLRVYVDGSLIKSFEVGRVKRVHILIKPDSGLIEVKGQDAVGELMVAILPGGCDRIPAEGVFRDSVVREGGYELEIQLTPIKTIEGQIEVVELRLTYTESRSIRAIATVVPQVWLNAVEGFRIRTSRDKQTSFGWLLATGVLIAVVALALMFLWLRESPRPKVPEQSMQPPVEEQKPAVPPEAPQLDQPRTQKEPRSIIARATWSADPASALSAIPIEPTRGEVRTVDLSRQASLFLSLPAYDHRGGAYSRYRVNISAGDKEVWQQDLRPPKVKLAGGAHILRLVLSPERLSTKLKFDLRVEGLSVNGWRPLGRLVLDSR